LDIDFQKVQEWLRKEEEINPAFRQDPLASIALMLGEMTVPIFEPIYEQSLIPIPEILAFMRLVVSRHWPLFRSLAEDGQKEWVGAARLLWGSTTPSPLVAPSAEELLKTWSGRRGSNPRPTAWKNTLRS
jgi:hypothetical protein